MEWFEPGISGLTDEPLEWFDNWEAFLINSIPTLDPTIKLVMPNIN
jgi:hypothetical protein